MCLRLCGTSWLHIYTFAPPYTYISIYANISNCKKIQNSTTSIHFRLFIISLIPMFLPNVLSIIEHGSLTVKSQVIEISSRNPGPGAVLCKLWCMLWWSVSQSFIAFSSDPYNFTMAFFLPILSKARNKCYKHYFLTSLNRLRAFGVTMYCLIIMPGT